jgi:hypothetical protein
VASFRLHIGGEPEVADDEVEHGPKTVLLLPAAQCSCRRGRSRVGRLVVVVADALAEMRPRMTSGTMHTRKRDGACGREADAQWHGAEVHDIAATVAVEDGLTVVEASSVNVAVECSMSPCAVRLPRRGGWTTAS